MGVPTFYRWLCTRFPKVPRDIPPESENSGDESPGLLDSVFNERFDNLYLDMNGIVHPCCHPEDLPQPTNEDEMFEAIFDYIDRLVNLIKPKRLLYLALDGVAPRAKMNQQRTRRFKSVYEKEYANRLKIENPSEDQSETNRNDNSKGWDSNVITPGTPFMYKLGVKLEEYVALRLERHDVWRQIAVIISDSNSPGEGEHKIVNFIRAQRQYKGHDPNTVHVIHGMDADLIMLALSTHEPNFYILREVIPQNHGYNSPRETVLKEPYKLMLRKRWKPLQFLQIPVLREYLGYIFKNCGNDFERSIDDLVLMCFFCGNDFLPHLPSMSITLGSIDQMIFLYQQIFSCLGDYLTDNGKINMPQLEIFTSYLTAVEHEVLCIKSNHIHRSNNDNSSPDEVEKSGIDFRIASPDEYKRNYYMSKIGCSEAKVWEVAADMSKEYIKGMEWVLAYYYQGIPSWKWFYPYHYAPFASDLEFKSQHTFVLGKPFTPFQQLMSVLPLESSHCLPPKMAELMKDEDSPLALYYPKELKFDPNGARYRYQWVLLLPFIDENVLISTVVPLEEELNEEDKARNATSDDRLLMHCSSKDKIGPGSTRLALFENVGKVRLISSKDSVAKCSFECAKGFRHSSTLLKNVKIPPKCLHLGDLMDEGRSKGFNNHLAKRMISHHLSRLPSTPTRYEGRDSEDEKVEKRGRDELHEEEWIDKKKILGGYSLKRPPPP